MRKTQILLVLAVLLIGSCRYKIDDRPNWDADYIAPLLKSSVTLEDALQDSSMVEVNPDNSLTLVLRDTVVNFKLVDLIEVPDTNLQFTVTLDSIQLTTDSLIQRMTLGTLSKQAGFEAIWLLVPGGKGNLPNWAQIDAQKNISSDPIEIDASQFFQQATLIGGFMDIAITNELPTDLDSVVFSLRNKGLYGNTDTVVKVVIPFIPKFTTYDTAIFMGGGKKVESLMEGQLINLNSDTIHGGTYVDSSGQYIELKITMRDLGASDATAVFPEQSVINAKGVGEYVFGNDIQLTRLGIREGTLHVEAINTIQNPIKFTFRIPAARKGGQIVSVISNLPKAPPGDTSMVLKNIDLSGNTIDLTLKGDSVNRFRQFLVGDLQYTGELVTMTLQDSIRVFYGLIDIIPEYVEGYLGKHTFEFQEGLLFDFFNSVTGGTLDLKNPSMKLSFANSVGIDGELQIREVTGYNTRDNTSVTLTGNPISGSIDIPGPKLPNVGQTITSSVELNKQNSNIKDLINLLPDSMYFDMQVLGNHRANPLDLNNFATGESGIAAVMDLEIPLHGMANNLTLETESDLNISDANISDDVKEGGLNLIVENYFPFEADIQVYFYDNAKNIVDSLFLASDNSVIGAGIADQSGLVTTPTKAELGSYFNSNRMDQLKMKSTSAKIKFKLNTRPSNQDVKVYSNYRIDFRLVGDFKYQVGG